MATYIKDLFDLPDVVRGGDFVLRLAESLERPEQTLRDYVVTAQLAKCFDDALSLVRDALEGRTSKACYLLGSFGSGKSHFMAVLNLLLQQNATAREISGEGFVHAMETMRRASAQEAEPPTGDGLEDLKFSECLPATALRSIWHHRQQADRVVEFVLAQPLTLSSATSA